mmetsp:Transcript_14432/g.29059  ORF Transcript_14432/g.29059 Transcript_14432/m.29059 type:complete len:133 (-) Transcript_14432:392-790(-)
MRHLRQGIGHIKAEGIHACNAGRGSNQINRFRWHPAYRLIKRLPERGGICGLRTALLCMAYLMGGRLRDERTKTTIDRVIRGAGEPNKHSQANRRIQTRTRERVTIKTSRKKPETYLSKQHDTKDTFQMRDE